VDFCLLFILGFFLLLGCASASSKDVDSKEGVGLCQKYGAAQMRFLSVKTQFCRDSLSEKLEQALGLIFGGLCVAEKR